jgi:uncharacterized protein YlxP (DUF503 family)
MFIGVARVKLRLPENQSLKGKRQVIKPIITRLQNHFNVAVAEVGDQDLWQSSEIGIACVSDDAQHASEMLARVLAFVEGSRLDAEVTDYETEIIPAF